MIGEQPGFAAIVAPETAQDAPPDDQAVAPEPCEMELDVKIDTVLNTSTLAITEAQTHCRNRRVQGSMESNRAYCAEVIEEIKTAEVPPGYEHLDAELEN